MSLTETGISRNLAWTRQLIEGEIAHQRSRARELRDEAIWRAAQLREQASQADAEASRLERQLSQEQAA